MQVRGQWRHLCGDFEALGLFLVWWQEITSSTRNRRIRQRYIHTRPRLSFILFLLYSLHQQNFDHRYIFFLLFNKSTLAILLDTLAFSQLPKCVLHFSSPSRLPFPPLSPSTRASIMAPPRPMAPLRARQISKMSSRRLRTSSALPASRVLVSTLWLYANLILNLSEHC